MSQFLLIISSQKPSAKVSNISFAHVSKSQEVFLNVCKHYSINPLHAWAVLDETGDTSDQLFSDAMLTACEFKSLENTKLELLLDELFKEKIKLIGWYGTDFEDLESFNSDQTLINYLVHELSTFPGEVYFQFNGK